uniref:Apolipoprotein D n=1 Tax=Varanus komodoensis TaxID=61221 RepID=A0A8D2JGQ7_VARKO
RLGGWRALPFLLGLLSMAKGQTFHMGKCPDPPVQEEFDLAKYVGKWYEIEKLPMSFEKGRCIEANYSLKENGKVKVVNKELLTGRRLWAEVARCPAGPGSPPEGRCRLSPVMPAAPYWVVSTDYENYALVYSCTTFLWLFHVDYAWILSRTRQMHPETVDHLKSILQSYEIDTARMRPTDQRTCPADM